MADETEREALAPCPFCGDTDVFTTEDEHNERNGKSQAAETVRRAQMRTLRIFDFVVRTLVFMFFVVVTAWAAIEGDWFAAAALLACGILAALPPVRDPAVRLKEWLERGRQ